MQRFAFIFIARILQIGFSFACIKMEILSSTTCKWESIWSSIEMHFFQIHFINFTHNNNDDDYCQQTPLLLLLPASLQLYGPNPASVCLCVCSCAAVCHILFVPMYNVHCTHHFKGGYRFWLHQRLHSLLYAHCSLFSSVKPSKIEQIHFNACLSLSKVFIYR